MRVKVWDAPTRVFHWALVVLIPLSWWTAEQEMFDLHVPLGLVTLGLLLFRLMWGLVGGSTARFAAFVKGPRAAIGYLSGRVPPVLGHNPFGGWSVIAMLAALATQVGLGLFAGDEDGLESGPLAHLVSYDLAEEIADLHEDMFNVLLVLIALHVAAILFYAIVRRRNLVKPMITGSDDAPEGTPPMRQAPAWRFVLAAGAAAAATLWIAAGA